MEDRRNMLDALAALHCEIVHEHIRFPFDLWLLVRDVHLVVIAIHREDDPQAREVGKIFFDLIRYFTPHEEIFSAAHVEHGKQDFTATLTAIVNWAKDQLNPVRGVLLHGW